MTKISTKDALNNVYSNLDSHREAINYLDVCNELQQDEIKELSEHVYKMREEFAALRAFMQGIKVDLVILAGLRGRL